MAAATVDTIILGAGWAGAVAARDLVRAGRSVLVLEARDRVGGRARTYTSPDAQIDLGCSWIHGYNEGNPTRAIAKSLGVVAHLPKPAEGVIYGPQGPLSPETAATLRSALGAAQAEFKTPHPAPPPSQSLASALFDPSSPLLATTTGVDPELARGLARTLEVPLGLKLEKASLRWAGWESATNFAGSDAAPEGGYEALVARVLDDARAGGAHVRLSAEVVGVAESQSGGVVTVTTTTGESFTARTVISTIPLGVLKVLPPSFFQPPLPPHLAETIAGTHVGVLEKLLLRYPTAWWPRASEIGSYTFLPTRSEVGLTAESPLADVLAASTLITANFAAPSLPGPTPTLLTYLSETPARFLLGHPAESVAAAMHTFLVSRLAPTAEPPRPTDYALTSWLLDEYARGATTTPSIASTLGERSPLDFKELSRPVWGGKLGFAGEHTEMENRGSVAGAVISGQREAARVDRFLAL